MPTGPSRWSTVFAAASAVLCATFVVMWIHSAGSNDVLLEPRREGDRWLVTSAFGTLTFERQDIQPGGTRPPNWVYFHKSIPENWPGRWQWFGFDVYRGQSMHYILLPPVHAWGVSAPHWPFIVLTGLLPLWWLRRLSLAWEGKRRWVRGKCPGCGYDLRATPEAAAQGGPALKLPRCPECGLIPTGPGGAATAAAGGVT